jgi:hypothetical protein
MKEARTAAIAALVFLGLSGIVGGVGLIAQANGEPFTLPQSLLQYSPFHSYLIPGIILLAANGLLSLWVLWLTVIKHRGCGWWVITQACVLSGWLIVEMVMLRLVVWPHYLYGTVALALAVSGIAMVRDRRQGTEK